MLINLIVHLYSGVCVCVRVCIDYVNFTCFFFDEVLDISIYRHIFYTKGSTMRVCALYHIFNLSFA